MTIKIHRILLNTFAYKYHWVATLKKRIRYEDILGTMDAIALFRPLGVPWTRLTLNVLKKNIKKTNKQLAREKTTWVLKCAKLFKLFQCAICEETVIRICTLQWSKVLGAFVTGFRANGTYPWDILRYSNGMETSFGWDQVTGRHQLLAPSVWIPTSEDIPSHHKPSYSKLSSSGVKTGAKIGQWNSLQPASHSAPCWHRRSSKGDHTSDQEHPRPGRLENHLLQGGIYAYATYVKLLVISPGTVEHESLLTCVWCIVSLGQGEKHGCI